VSFKIIMTTSVQDHVSQRNTRSARPKPRPIFWSQTGFILRPIWSQTTSLTNPIFDPIYSLLKANVVYMVAQIKIPHQ